MPDHYIFTLPQSRVFLCRVFLHFTCRQAIFVQIFKHTRFLSIRSAYHSGNLLYLQTMKSFDEQLEHLVREAMQEDIGDGDHSTLSVIPAEAKGRAILKIKENGVLAGIEVAEKIFRIQAAGYYFSGA